VDRYFQAWNAGDQAAGRMAQATGPRKKKLKLAVEEIGGMAADSQPTKTRESDTDSDTDTDTEN